MQTLQPFSPQVFYNSEFLKRHWSQFLDFVAYRPRDYGYQSVMIMRKAKLRHDNAGSRLKAENR